MRTVSISDLKARLSAHIQLFRDGKIPVRVYVESPIENGHGANLVRS